MDNVFFKDGKPSARKQAQDGRRDPNDRKPPKKKSNIKGVSSEAILYFFKGRLL